MATCTHSRAPGHYELIRWDLTKLPKETFPPISNTSPTMTFDGPTTAKIGEGLIVWVSGRDAEPGRMRFSSSALPASVELRPKQSSKKAALVWIPTEDQIGENNIDVKVEDAMCGRATQTLKISVEPAE